MFFFVGKSSQLLHGLGKKKEEGKVSPPVRAKRRKGVEHSFSSGEPGKEKKCRHRAVPTLLPPLLSDAVWRRDFRQCFAPQCNKCRLECFKKISFAMYVCYFWGKLCLEIPPSEGASGTGRRGKGEETCKKNGRKEVYEE